MWTFAALAAEEKSPGPAERAGKPRGSQRNSLRSGWPPMRARIRARRSARCDGESATEATAATIPLEALAGSWRLLRQMGTGTSRWPWMPARTAVGKRLEPVAICAGVTFRSSSRPVQKAKKLFDRSRGPLLDKPRLSRHIVGGSPNQGEEVRLWTPNGS